MSASPAKKGSPAAVNALIPTGGQIDEVTMALIGAANDSDSKVRASVAASLHDIGHRQTPLVVSSCVDWLLRNGAKAAKEHKVTILTVANRLIDEKRDLISQELASNAVGMAMEELVMDKEVVPELQEAACRLVVSLSALVPGAVVDALMGLFQPGVVPHYFVVKTLGDVAAANPTEVVPRLREALSRMNPLLASLKHDNLKWVFATALWQFCDALQQYKANADRASDRGAATASFAAELLSAFEILLTRWASSGDKRLKLAVLRALGQMAAVFSAEEFEIQAPKVIPLLLGLLRKEAKDVLHITQALCALLETGVAAHSPCIQLPTTMGPILQTLHGIVCMVPDFSNSPALKNYGEALRCFEVLARGWPEAVLTFVLGRLEPKDAPSRLGALAVLKHLVVSVNKELEDKKGLLVSGVKPLVLSETNTAVRKSLAQLVVAMASHDYLELEGGENLVEFIVRCCSYEEPNGKHGDGKAAAPLEVQSSLELRDVCDNILYLSTTTIPSMERVLWPYLFELVVPLQYTGATSSVAKALAHVASRKRESGSEEYWVDFDKHVNLPKPQQLMAKLFIMLCMPNRRPGLGVNVLNALRAIGPILHPAVCDMWDEKIPKLVAYLEDRLPKPDWDVSAWEELVLRLLAETVRIANDDEWAIALGDAIVTHIEALGQRSETYLRGVGMKQLGIVLQRNGSKDFVRKILEVLFQVATHTDELERQGCATAYGYTAASHLDIVLEKLQQIYPACTGKRGGGLFGGKSTAVSYAPEAKNTVMLSYGYVASYASPALITSRVEIHIVTVLRPYLLAPKSTTAMRTAIATAVNLIAKAMHPGHLQMQFVFKARDELAKTIADYISAKDAELDASLRLACLEALASLCLLEPAVPEELEKHIAAATVRVLTLNIGPALKDGAFAPGTCSEKTMEQLQTKVDNLLAALLFMQPSVSQLRRLLEYLHKMLLAAPDAHRERATVSVHNLLRKFIQFSPTRRVDASFANLGETVAMPLPRCTDVAPKVRRSAVECIGLMLYIDHSLSSAAAASSASAGTPPPPDCLKQLNAIRDRTERGTKAEQLSAMEDLAGVFADAVRQEEVVPLIVHSLRAMLDVQPAGQLGAVTVANVVLARRGKSLLSSVPEIVNEFLDITAQVKETETMDLALVAFRTLAAHHLVPVLTALLEEPVPHADNVVRLLQALARDEALAAPMTAHLAALLNTSCLHEEKSERSKVVYCPLPSAMSATAALEEVMRLGDVVAPLVAAHFAQFLCTVMLRVGTCARAESRPFVPRPPTKDAKPGKAVTVSPQAQATEAVRQFVNCLGPHASAVVAAMDEMVPDASPAKGKGASSGNFWKLLESPEKYTQSVTRLTNAVLECQLGKDHAQDVYAYLAPFVRGNYLEQRVVTAVMMAEMVAHCTGSPELLDRLMTAMTEGLADPALLVHVLRGLGNVASNEAAAVDRYSSTVVDALTPPLNGADEELAMEAITGLSKVFEVVDEELISPFLVNLCAQIRPSFTKESVGIRAAAFQLFGLLARFGANKSCAERFVEQIHAVLPSLLLHLYDEEESVQKACKYTLRRCAPLTGAETLAALVEKSMFEPETPVVAYDLMAEELSKALIAHFPERVSYYLMQCVEGYRSSWNRIKANAAVMTGMLLGNLPVDKRNKATLNPTIITRALISLLKERNAEVRQKAAEAMAVLYTY